MVIVWVGIAIGVLIIIVLIAKLLKTPAHSAVRFEQHCQKCGEITHGLKCPKCDRRPSFGV
jgi:cytochrome c-type biogenesis protein CcmH/NrfF